MFDQRWGACAWAAACLPRPPHPTRCNSLRSPPPAAARRPQAIALRSPGAQDSTDGEEGLTPLLTADDFEETRGRALEAVEVPAAVLQLIADLRSYLQDKCEPPVYVSDRRLVKAVALMQVGLGGQWRGWGVAWWVGVCEWWARGEQGWRAEDRLGGRGPGPGVPHAAPSQPPSLARPAACCPAALRPLPCCQLPCLVTRARTRRCPPPAPQVAAYTSGRQRVAEYDCLLLRHLLWQRPDEAERIYDWLLSNLASDDGLQQMQYLLSGMFGRACKSLGDRGELAKVAGEVGALRAALVDKLAGGARQLGAGRGAGMEAGLGWAGLGWAGLGSVGGLLAACLAWSRGQAAQLAKGSSGVPHAG